MQIKNQDVCRGKYINRKRSPSHTFLDGQAPEEKSTGLQVTKDEKRMY